MARKASFDYYKTADGWMVNCPASLAESGRRERHFFTTRDLAKDYAASLRERVKKFGEAATAIHPSLAEAAALAASILEPWGVGVVEAARFFAAARARETASRPLDEAADEWLVHCEAKDLRARTLSSYRASVRKLKASLGSRVLATLTAADMQAAVAPAGSAGTAVQGEIRNARAFWLWAVKKGWCSKDAFTVAAPGGSQEKEIEILKPEAVRCLLDTAARYFPQAVPIYAVQLFGGLRAQEASLLQAENVSPDGIELLASVAKKRRRRHIALNPTLAAWLEKFPFESCGNWQRVDAACRKLAGWDLKSSLVAEMVASGALPKSPKPTRGAWPQNCLRHSHASYAIAAGEIDLKDLLFEFGHSGSEDLLRTNYVGVASKRTALEFFAILPPGAAKPEVLKAVKSSQKSA